MFSLGEILVLMHQPLSQTLSKLPLYANLAGAGASLLCLGGLRSKSLGLHSKVLLCHAFLLLTAAAIAFGEASSRTVGNGFGQSRLTLLIILIPVLLPLNTLATIGVATAALTMQFFAQGAVVALGLPVWPAPQALGVFLGDLLAMGAALLPALAIAEGNSKALQSFELGSYRLLNLLAEGGMGQVWYAEHKFLPGSAAVKLVKSSGLRADEQNEQAQNFKREAGTLSNLKSPHTVRVLDFGEDGQGRLYLAMELLDGFDLDRLVRQQGPVTPARVALLLSQACLSLHEAHEKQFVHRDIKPANLFVTHVLGLGDLVKVLDFGLVQTFASTRTGEFGDLEVVGTPEFMAPEVARGMPATPQSDIYSLGCLAFWLLTGQELFPNLTYLETMMAHQSQSPPRPSWRTEQPIPILLDRLVERCLHKDPARRPQTCLEIKQALEEIEFDEPWGHSQAKSWWESQHRDSII